MSYTRALALSACALACAVQTPDSAEPAPLEAIHAKVRSISVSAPPRADMIYSPGLLRFVGQDE
ncbi:MAG: hypothetical protein KC636_39710, partial [Myxococcales bacterium]|nr:hypothetical protein [Myxococcales bacterium]